MEKTKEKKDIKRKNKEPKKILNTKITISKLVSIFIIFLILLITIAFVRNKITDYKLFTQILETNLALFESDNLYLECIDYSDVNEISSHTKIWLKGNHAKKIDYIKNNLTTTSYYILDSNEIIFPKAETVNKTIHSHPITYSDLPTIIGLDFTDSPLIERFKRYSNLSDITIENIYNHTCYKVTYKLDKNDYETTWFDVKTLYPVKSIGLGDSSYIISECPLQEDELSTDTTGYKYIDYTKIESNYTN